MKNILITGGAGFLGTNISVKLLEKGYKVFVIDDLKNAYVSRVRLLQKNFPNLKFKKLDVCNLNQLEQVFKNEKFDTVIHLAARKYVGESFIKEKEYVFNNMKSLQNVLFLSKKYGAEHFAFASSITVYGNSEKEKLKESEKYAPVSPYAKTKQLGEEEIKRFAKENTNMTFTIFRFSNPVSANTKYMLGDNSKKHKLNLVSLVCKSAIENKKLVLKGNNHDTKDGTPIRDYFHVEDLAEIVCNVLEKQKTHFDTINVGMSGNGFSVLQIINQTEAILNKKLDYCFGNKKSGDVAKNVCDNSHLLGEYGRHEFRDIKQILEDEIAFRKSINEKSSK